MPRARTPAAQAACERRALNWLLAMQSDDGGWAAFDVDNNWELLNQVPFADHNAMLDPTCPDITGRVVEALRAAASTATKPCGAASRISGVAGGGWELVRALGRELHLRQFSGDARAWRRARQRGGGKRFRVRRSGCGPYRMPMADGARVA